MDKLIEAFKVIYDYCEPRGCKGCPLYDTCLEDDRWCLDMHELAECALEKLGVHVS